jgi:enoyl-CoA hydratase/carnithine racemase
MDYALIQLQVESGIATLTLNRPDKRNAMSDDLRSEFIHALERVAADKAIRALVLTGAGKAFCAGGDIAGMERRMNAPAGEIAFNGWHRQQRVHHTQALLHTMPKPVIAAVNGAAAGAGLSFACACDIRIAADSASFVPAFINIGLIPDSGGTYFISRLLGYARAFEWMTSGRKLSADEAHAWGLVSEVVEGDALAVRAADLAAQLAAMPTRGVGMTKLLFDEAAHNTLEQQLELEAELQTAATQTADFREGVAAFLEKREPRFEGR